MFCTHCRAPNPDAARFCYACGAELAGTPAGRTPAHPSAPAEGAVPSTATPPPYGSGPPSHPSPFGWRGTPPPNFGGFTPPVGRRDAFEGLPTVMPDDHVASLQPGERLGPRDRYEIVKLLGRGGMGAVYRARDLEEDDDIALKVLLPSLLGSEKARRNFLEEARMARSIGHPHVVRVFGTDESAGLRFILMEFLIGRTLREELKALRAGSRLMPVADLQRRMLQACAALDYLHGKKIIHRDVKPENLYLTSTADEETVKLLDFGIAVVMDPEAWHSSSRAQGTAGYLAPELLEGHEATPASDAFALGMVLIECLTGQLPTGLFRPPSAERSDLDRRWDALVESMLERDPARRISSAQEIAECVRAMGSPAGAAPRAAIRPAPAAAPAIRRVVPGMSPVPQNAAGCEVFIRECDGARTILVPATTFRMGADDGEPWEAPAHEVGLRAFLLDESPVTWARYATFARAAGRPMPPRPSWEHGDDHPVVNVSWADAAAYCMWAGGRLPSEAEWECAAHADGRRFAWGSEWPPVRNGVALANLADESSGLGWHVPGYADAWPHTSPVGAFSDGTAPFGHLDIAGNVRQWCGDWFGPYPQGATTSPRGRDRGDRRVVRGASFYDGCTESIVRPTSRAFLGPGARHEFLGFRCVVDFR